MNTRLRLCVLGLLVSIVPCVALTLAAQPDAAAQPAAPAKMETRFVSVDVFVDSGTAALAAYQVEFSGMIEQGIAGSVKLVGIEGAGGVTGSAFEQPPGYDPAALAKDRVIIADYSTLAAEKLPRGKSRVARLHLMIESATPGAKAEYTVKLAAAGSPDGAHIQAAASVVEGEGR